MKSLLVFALIAGMMGCAKKPITLPKCDPPNVLKLYSDMATCSLQALSEMSAPPEPSPQFDNRPFAEVIAKPETTGHFTESFESQGFNNSWVLAPAVKPEPMDVPAIKAPKDGDIRCATYIGSWVEIPCTDLFTPRPAEHDWACGSKRDGTASKCPDWLFPKPEEK